MFFKAKEISVDLSSEDIQEKLRKLSSNKRFLCKITADSFFIRIRSNRPSIFRTSVKAFFRGKISSKDSGKSKITYRVEPPIIFWLQSILFILLLIVFLIGIFRTMKGNIQLNYKLAFFNIAWLLFFGIMNYAESLSQAKISEERFLKAFKQQADRQPR